MICDHFANTALNMRFASLFFCCCLVLATGVSDAAEPDQAGKMVEDISSAIEKGSARELARFFSSNVELSMPRAEGTYSKSQSEMIVRDFFSRNTPSSFTIRHQGTARDGSVYVFGRLKTKNGNTYRCFFLVKKISDTYFLHHLQFESV